MASSNTETNSHRSLENWENTFIHEIGMKRSMLIPTRHCLPCLFLALAHFSEESRFECEKDVLTVGGTRWAKYTYMYTHTPKSDACRQTRKYWKIYSILTHQESSLGIVRSSQLGIFWEEIDFWADFSFMFAALRSSVRSEGGRMFNEWMNWLATDMKLRCAVCDWDRKCV